MSEQNVSKNKHPFWSSLGGILSGIATLITAVVAVYQITKEPRPENDTEKPKVTLCNEPLVWDSELQSCVRKVVVSDKTFSIPLKKPIDEISGNIFFYLNRERLPDVNSAAQIREASGVVQVFIAVMLDKKMVGEQRGSDLLH